MTRDAVNWWVRTITVCCILLAGAWSHSLEAAGSGLVVIKRVQPKYPRRAAMAQKEGFVTMSFIIAADGSVKEVKVVKAKPKRIFDRAAVRALSQWKFEPIMVDGTAVDKEVTLTIDFRL